MPGLLIAVSACNGILGDIYDEAPKDADKTYGFVDYDGAHHRGRLFLDVVSYKEWTFVDLRHRSFEARPIPATVTGEWDGRSGWTYYQVTFPATFDFRELVRTDSVPTPAHWDLAIHHYDVRTNGGEALETPFSSLDDLLARGNRAALLSQPFQRDEWTTNVAYYDLTGIYNYYIGYHNTPLNHTLGRWMNMNVEHHPPTYALSQKVYLLRLADNTVAALHFQNYMNRAGAKGYLTLEYIYPY